MAKNNPTKRSFFGKKLLFIVLYVLIVAGLAAFGGIYYTKYQDLKTATPEQLQQSQIDETLKEVGKLYALPANEKPDVATVKDKEALKKQYPFFDQAENGDIVLIYKEAKLALLYRPGTKQLVKVGPVNIESGLSIRTVGSAGERATVEKLLSDNKLTFSTGGEAKTDISGVLVVDLSGKNGEQAKKVAEVVKGTVGSLPAGEEKPTDVDILILAGPETTTPTPEEIPQP